MFSRRLSDEKVKVSSSKILNTRKRVVDALTPFCGGILTSDSISSASAALSFCIPKACIDFAFSQDMLLRFLRQPMGVRDVQTIAAKIAGNMPLLMQGVQVKDTDWIIRSDWGLIKILSVEKAVRVFKDGNKQRGIWVDLDVMSGPASSMLYRRFWSSDMCNYAKYRIGFGRSEDNNKYPYLDESNFTSLYFLGYFDHLAARDKPDYTEFLCNDYVVSKNREVLRKRYRSIHRNEEFRCPREYPVTVNCHRCPAGLDECEAATHLHTYQEKHCDGCNKTSWVDPGKPGKCVDCVINMSLNLID